MEFIIPYPLPPILKGKGRAPAYNSRGLLNNPLLLYARAIGRALLSIGLCWVSPVLPVGRNTLRDGRLSLVPPRWVIRSPASAASGPSPRHPRKAGSVTTYGCPIGRLQGLVARNGLGFAFLARFRLRSSSLKASGSRGASLLRHAMLPFSVLEEGWVPCSRTTIDSCIPTGSFV